MMQNPSKDKINAQAREWFTTMQSGSCTEAQRHELEHWLAESSAHKDAYDEYEAIWQTLGELASTTEGAALRRSVANEIPSDRLASWTASVLASLQRLLNPPVALALATICITISTLFFFSSSNEFVSPALYQTARGETRAVRLVDGSDVVLAAKSKITFVMTATNREAVLVDGRAFFKVAKDKSKPFYVRAGDTVIRVVGTEFDVNQGHNQVKISVIEGVVSVSDVESGGAKPIVLTAGQQATHEVGGLVQLQTDVSTDAVDGWRSGRLVYQRARLDEVVHEVNRYYPGVINLDPSLAELEVTAAFNANQLDSFPETLESFLPIRVQREKNNQVLLLPK